MNAVLTPARTSAADDLVWKSRQQTHHETVATPPGLWEFHPVAAGDTLRIDGPHGVSLPVALLYEGVNFAAAAAGAPES